MFFFIYKDHDLYVVFTLCQCRCMVFSNTYTDNAPTVLLHNDNKSGFVFYSSSETLAPAVVIMS